MIRNSFRALALLVGGLLIAATWPPLALPAGGAVATGAVWRFRSRLRLGAPYLVAGALLVTSGPALAWVAPHRDTTTVTDHPVRYCQPGHTAC